MSAPTPVRSVITRCNLCQHLTVFVCAYFHIIPSWTIFAPNIQQLPIDKCYDLLILYRIIFQHFTTPFVLGADDKFGRLFVSLSFSS
jgi:hypothetical protein